VRTRVGAPALAYGRRKGEAVVTLAMYRRVFARALALTLANWPVLGTFFVYTVILALAAVFAAPFGILGGFILGLVSAACTSSFLYLVEMMVRTGKVSLDDFRRSFTAYLGEVLGVLFIFWVVQAVVAPALLSLPNGLPLLLGVQLIAFVFFNAVPEMIYLGHYSPLELLRESYRFIGENWIEWFPATIVGGLLIIAAGAIPAPGLLAWLRTALIALLVYFVMVVRGLLFLELWGSSRRSRAFRYRIDGSA
jgi:hypothetical protein